MSNGFIGPTRPDPKGIYGSPWGDIRDVGRDVFGSPWGDLGGTTPADGTTKTEAFPWWLIPIGISLLQSLFKKSPSQEAEDLKKQMAILGLQVPYQSPYMSTIDPVVLKALLAQLNRTSNWGWPAGKGIDTSFIQDALANVGNINPLGTGQTTSTFLERLRQG